jgi:hypothetical protein
MANHLIVSEFERFISDRIRAHEGAGHDLSSDHGKQVFARSFAREAMEWVERRSKPGVGGRFE